MILLTDGIPNRYPAHGNGEVSLLREANRIRNLGIKIIAIGVGKNVDNDLLAQITGDKSFVYSKETFAELKKSEFITKLARSICTDPVLKTSVLPFARTLKPTTPVKVKTTVAKPTTAASTSIVTTPKPSGPPAATTVDPDTGLCRCNTLKEIDFPALSLSVFDINQYPGINIDLLKIKVKCSRLSITRISITSNLHNLNLFL